METSFEANLKGLEKTVRALEGGELGLDAALQQYESGIRLLASCHKMLDEAGKKVALLTGVSQGGEAETDDFDSSATFEGTKKAGRIVREPEDDEDGLPF